MKRILFVAISIMMCRILYSPIIVHAETFAEKCQRMQRESDEEFAKRVSNDGNMTESASKALSRSNKTYKVNSESKSETNESKSSNSSSYSDRPRGRVYGVDELHLVGLPTDERGPPSGMASIPPF